MPLREEGEEEPAFAALSEEPAFAALSEEPAALGALGALVGAAAALGAAPSCLRVVLEPEPWLEDEDDRVVDFADFLALLKGVVLLVGGDLGRDFARVVPAALLGLALAEEDFVARDLATRDWAAEDLAAEDLAAEDLAAGRGALEAFFADAFTDEAFFLDVTVFELPVLEVLLRPVEALRLATPVFFLLPALLIRSSPPTGSRTIRTHA